MFNIDNQKYTFESNIRTDHTTQDIFKLPETELQKLIKNETMFWRADIDFATKHGGPLTKAFINELSRFPEWTKNNLIIDSRSHMLMSGQCPAIPGYHLDSVPRELPNKQPNHKTPSYEADHCMMILGDCSRTEFAVGKVELPEITEDQLYYREWHPLVEKMIEEGRLFKVTAKPNELIFFNWQAWHQGVEATKRGFRWFIRATVNTTIKVENEIRVNANVYMKYPYAGW